MPYFGLNPKTANELDPIIEHGHMNVIGKPAISRRNDAAELRLRPDEVARIHMLPLQDQKRGKPPVPNMMFFAVRQNDMRGEMGWRVEHFMFPDEMAADALALDIDRFRKVWAEVEKGSDEDRNNFVLRVLFAIAPHDVAAASILRGILVPHPAKIDPFYRDQFIPL